jgi:hypothetical protein
VADSRGHSIEPSGSIKGGKFLDQLSHYWLLNKDSASCCSQTLYDFEYLRDVIIICKGLFD